MTQDELSLREYFNRRFDDTEKIVTAKLDRIESLYSNISGSFGKRIDIVESTIIDFLKSKDNFVTRQEYSRGVQDISDKISDLCSRLDKNDGKSQGINAGWGYLVGIIGFISVVISTGSSIFS